MKISLEPIKPKHPIFDTAKFTAESARVTRIAVDGIKADYQKTVATWTHKPTFYTTRRGYIWYIGTKDKIYSYVELGTKPHIISSPFTARGPAGFLRFYRTGFRPKSRAGYIASYAGSKANKDLVFTNVVHHPGTKARNFSEKIRVKWEKEFAKLMRAAVKNSAR